MKHQRISIAPFLLLVALALTFVAETTASEDTARAEVERVVLASYVHGAFNEQDTVAMKSGFHPIFKIHGVRDGELSTYPIAEWIAGIEKRKQSDDYEPQTWEHRFPLTDVSGNAAIVKVELYRVEGAEKSLVFTDYLSLLKLDGQWKITDKVYHHHSQQP